MSMVTVCTGRASLPNRGPNKDSVDFSWADVFKRIFPENTAPSVASFTRTKIRAVELVMEKPQRGISGRALINLLRSPVGRQVLDAILGDAPPDWRANELRLIAIADLEKQIEEHKQNLASLRKPVGG